MRVQIKQQTKYTLCDIDGEEIDLDDADFVVIVSPEWVIFTSADSASGTLQVDRSDPTKVYEAAYRIDNDSVMEYVDCVVNTFESEMDMLAYIFGVITERRL